MKNSTLADVEIPDVTSRGSVILPGVVLHEGVAAGALILIHKNCRLFRHLRRQYYKKDREKDLLILERRMQDT